MHSHTRILTAFTVLAAITASAAGWFAFGVARNSLEQAARDTLAVGREARKKQVLGYLEALKNQIAVEASLMASLPPTLHALESRQRPGITRSDVLPCSDLRGTWPATLQQSWRELCAHPQREFILTDFTQTDYGILAFLLVPMPQTATQRRGSSLLAYWISPQSLNAIMLGGEVWVRSGLGRSGETYLVGSDMQLRTESRFLKENPSEFLAEMERRGVQADVLKKIRDRRSSLLELQVNSEAARAALRGETGTITTLDYRHIEVLSSFTPVDFGGVRWALLSEIDTGEAFAPIAALRSQLLLLTAIFALVFLLMGSLLTRAVARPLDNLARQALGMSEALQRRIGHDLHDDLAQRIVGISLLAKSMLRSNSKMDEALEKDVRRLAELTDAAIQTTRELAHGLSPVPLLRDGLRGALHRLASEIAERTPSLLTETDIDTDLPHFNDEESLHLFRIAQEAIANAIKHGHATRIWILLKCDERGTLLDISNNGTPFSEPEKESGIGLALMAMRCRVLQGSFQIRARGDGITTVACQFPHTRRST